VLALGHSYHRVCALWCLADIDLACSLQVLVRDFNIVKAFATHGLLLRLEFDDAFLAVCYWSVSELVDLTVSQGGVWFIVCLLAFHLVFFFIGSRLFELDCA